MRTFSKKIRLERYKIALAHINRIKKNHKKFERGICLALTGTGEINDYYPFSNEQIKIMYPELYAYMPSRGYTYNNQETSMSGCCFWWKIGDRVSRIEVLTEIINKMEGVTA